RLGAGTTNPRPILLVIAAAVMFAAAGSALISSPPGQTREQLSGASSAIPERDVWKDSWVFETRGTERRPLAALRQYFHESRQIGPIPIRLENGTLGTLSVAAGPCGPQDTCTGPRHDCGCFENDSYWIRIADRS